MRTAHALTVSPSMPCTREAGGLHGVGGCMVRGGVHGPRGGGIPACIETDPPCEQNDKQV